MNPLDTLPLELLHEVSRPSKFACPGVDSQTFALCSSDPLERDTERSSRVRENEQVLPIDPHVREPLERDLEEGEAEIRTARSHRQGLFRTRVRAPRLRRSLRCECSALLSRIVAAGIRAHVLGISHEKHCGRYSPTCFDPFLRRRLCQVCRKDQ